MQRRSWLFPLLRSACPQQKSRKRLKRVRDRVRCTPAITRQPADDAHRPIVLLAFGAGEALPTASAFTGVIWANWGPGGGSFEFVGFYPLGAALAHETLNTNNSR